jgi:hypothetical protein
MVKLNGTRAFVVFINTDTRIPLNFAHTNRISLLCIVSDASIQVEARYKMDGPVLESRWW